MNFFDKTLGAIGLQRKGANIPLASGIDSNSFAIFGGSGRILPAKAMQLYNGWVYACVRAIAEGLAGLRIRLFRVDKKGNTEELFEHELLDILSAVNQFQTAYDLKFLLGSHLELTGNAYWFLDGVKNLNDQPTAIYPLNPKFITVVKAPLPQFIKGYKYTVDFSDTFLQPYQVLHFKYPNPDDLYEGKGTVESVIDWINQDNWATLMNAKYFKNGGKLGHILKPKNSLNPSQMTALKQSWESLQGGADNAYRAAVLPVDMDIDKASDNPKDMDFANLQTMMRDKILSGFRVPRTVLGTAEDSTNRATAETSNYIFGLRTLKPKCELISQYLNEFLVPRYGDDLYLEFENPVPEDKVAKLEEMKAATGQQPVISINEAREEFFSLEPIEGGDTVRGSAMMAEIGAPAEPKKSINKPIKKGSVRFAKNASNRNKIAESVAEKITQIIAEGENKFDIAKQKAIKNISTMSDDDFEPIHKAFVSRVTPYEEQVVKLVREFNAKQKKEVIDNLKKIIKGAKISKTDIFDIKKWIAALVDLVTPSLVDLFMSEGTEAMALMGASGFAITKEVRAAIDKAIALLSKSYNSTTLDALKTILEEGQAEGLGLDELASRVSDIYEFSNVTRAEVVARTETFRIANDATKEAWKQTGVVKTIKWYTAADERVCEFCAPMHGKTIGIDEDFFKKGDAMTGASGTELKFDYCDIGGGSLHPNCRCYTRPDEIEVNFDESKTQKNDDSDLDDILSVLKEQ
jgi:HK97 family phage portal protein